MVWCLNNQFWKNIFSESLLVFHHWFYLAMMYDFNFKYSYKYIKENDIVNKLFDLVNTNERFELYFKHMDKYIEEGSKQYVRKKI